MGRRIRGPTQLKRHLEKQKDLLEEAKRIILKELEWLQVKFHVVNEWCLHVRPSSDGHVCQCVVCGR